MTAAELAQHFQECFRSTPKIYRAPGRVNLIGEHTDYNDGFVLPAAIGFSAQVAVARRTDRKLVIRSCEFSGEFDFDLDHLPEKRVGAWCDYVLGVAVVLAQHGHRMHGANLLVHGDVPIGAGLSSSAAVEVASALALLSFDSVQLPPTEIAKLCRRAENEFVGARVGIMDPLVSCLGKAGHALYLDCRSLKFELVPIPANVRLVLCNTMVKHGLATGNYNRRREECEQGVRIFSEWDRQIRALRDVSFDLLERHAKDVPDVIWKRCAHVVRENQSVLDAARRLKENKLAEVGELMRESHRSLRDLYEVSCRELDIMVGAAEGLPGYYGGRMTGGGFGGCTVNLLEADAAQAFVVEVAQRYRRATGIDPQIYVCSAEDGAQALSS
jgi:galactokinase